MTPSELRVRTKQFAVRVVRVCRVLPRTDEGRVVSRQLLRSGTGIGANYRAACRPRSDADFIAKLGLVIEECDETAFWFELLIELKVGTREVLERGLDEVEQLTRIFVASRETARRNAKARRTKSTNR